MSVATYIVFRSATISMFETLGPALEAAWLESVATDGTPVNVYAHDGSDSSSLIAATVTGVPNP